MSRSQYIFNHFPKTGGTSLLAVCRENLEPGEISPHLVDLDVRFRPPARFENYRLIAGHFSLLTQMGFCRSRYSITMLRHPIKRIVSTYAYYRIATERSFLRSKARELSFAEFVDYFKDSPLVVHNPYCHHFAAMPEDFPDYPVETDALLATAKHNLAAYDFVGICEEFARSASFLCRQLGWRPPAAMPHENRSSSETQFSEIAPDTMKILRDRTQLDVELFEHARRLFEMREAAATPGMRAESLGPVEPNRFVPLPAPLEVCRRAVIRSVTATWVPSDQSRTLEIGVNFATTKPVKELGLGVLITDAAGRSVWGISTAEESMDLDFAAGLDTRASFLLECELPPGVYNVTIALADPSRFGFSENWIDHAVPFLVAPSQISDESRVHFVRLLQFGSSASRRPDRAQTPMWSESETVGPSAGRRRLELIPHSAPIFPESKSVSTPAPYPQTQYPPHGYLDADARLANPQVRLQLVGRREDSYSQDRCRLFVTITNLGDETLSSRYTFPVNLSYHWMSGDHTVRQHDGLRTGLLFDVLPGESSTQEVIVGPPPDSSCSLLCITLVQESVCWFDECEPGNKLLLPLREIEALSA